MNAPLPPFSIMAKPTCGACNLDCDYCYYTAKKSLYPGTERFMMEEAVLAAYVHQYQRCLDGEVVYSWQGGEPLLAGLDFYRRALELQETHRRPGQVISNTLQTNGTLLDESWCAFLRDNSFLVGLSLDGPAELHDHHRRDGAGRGSFERAWHGLEHMRREGVEFNVLVTLNRNNVARGADLYRWFVERGVTWLQFIPILEKDEKGAPTPWSCPPEEYGRFLCEVFDTWHRNDLGRVSVRIFESVMFSLVKGDASVCCLSRRCANAHVLEWNGDLYACDHFVEPAWRLGNILETPLTELVHTPRLEAFAALKTGQRQECKACPSQPLCWGGCPKHILEVADGGRRNHFCDAYKRFFDHSRERFTALADEIRGPRGPAPGEEGVDGAQAPPVRTKTGRNDPCPCGSGRKFKRCCGG